MNKLPPSLCHNSRSTTLHNGEDIKYVNTTLLTPTAAQWYVVFFVLLSTCTYYNGNVTPPQSLLSVLLFLLLLFLSQPFVIVDGKTTCSRCLISWIFYLSVCLWILFTHSHHLVASFFSVNFIFHLRYSFYLSRVLLLLFLVVIFRYCSTNGFTTTQW